MPLSDTATLAKSQTFQERVTAAIITAALQISGEPVDSARLDEPGFLGAATSRQELAHRILLDPAGVSVQFAWAIAANPTISAAGEATTDSDIAYVVTTIWDDMAGAAPILAVASSLSTGGLKFRDEARQAAAAAAEAVASAQVALSEAQTARSAAQAAQAAAEAAAVRAEAAAGPAGPPAGS